MVQRISPCLCSFRVPLVLCVYVVCVSWCDVFCYSGIVWFACMRLLSVGCFGKACSMGFGGHVDARWRLLVFNETRGLYIVLRFYWVLFVCCRIFVLGLVGLFVVFSVISDYIVSEMVLFGRILL